MRASYHVHDPPPPPPGYNVTLGEVRVASRTATDTPLPSAAPGGGRRERGTRSGGGGGRGENGGGLRAGRDGGGDGGLGGHGDGLNEKNMVYFPNPGARAIAISMSVVHQHAGSPYINGRDDVLENHFPIGMVFIFVTFAGVGLIAMMCGLLKLAEKRKERREEDDGEDGEEAGAGGKRPKRSMPTLSMLRPPSPRRDLLRRSNLDYLSVAALPLLSYRMLTRVASLRQGQGSQGQAKAMSRDFSDFDEFGDIGEFGGFGECGDGGGGGSHLNGSVRGKGDRGCGGGGGGGGGESEESGADNLSVPLDYDEALSLGAYVQGPRVSQEDFCEIDLGLGGGVAGVSGGYGVSGGGELDYVNNTASNDPYTHYPHRQQHRHTANDLTKCNNIAPNNIAPPPDHHVAPNNAHKPGPMCGASRDGNIVMCINSCESVV